MKNLRSVYNIYQDVDGKDEYVETLEFNSDQKIMTYIRELKTKTGSDYTAKLSMLLVMDRKGSDNGKQFREK
jgi:hypothetical protein